MPKSGIPDSSSEGVKKGDKSELGASCGVACGVPWPLRVIDHKAVLLDPNSFSSAVQRPVVLLKRRAGRQTSGRWRCGSSGENVTASHAIFREVCEVSIPVLSTRKIVAGRQKLGWHFFSTALGLCGSRRCSGELRELRATGTHFT
jgi:hypothetical protein